MAASSNLCEILSSKTAQESAKNTEVKTLAQQMITGHTKTSAELNALAEPKNIMLRPVSQRQIYVLSTAGAAYFDVAYLGAQVFAQKEAVILFERAAATSLEPELNAYAQKTLPALRMHLKMTQN